MRGKEDKKMTNTQFSQYYRDDIVQIGKSAKKVPVDHDRINATKTEGSFVRVFADVFFSKVNNNAVK